MDGFPLDTFDDIPDISAPVRSKAKSKVKKAPKRRKSDSEDEDSEMSGSEEGGSYKRQKLNDDDEKHMKKTERDKTCRVRINNGIAACAAALNIPQSTNKLEVLQRVKDGLEERKVNLETIKRNEELVTEIRAATQSNVLKQMLSTLSPSDPHYQAVIMKLNAAGITSL